MNEIKTKYKSGQLFWGFLFLSIGILFLLEKNNFTILIPYDIWDYWPLLIIFWGVSIIAKGTIIKPILSTIAGIFVGLFIYSAIFGLPDRIVSDEEPEGEYTTSTFFEDFRDSTEFATLSLRTGVGKIIIDGITDKLIEGTSSGFNNNFSFKTRYRDNSARVVLRHMQNDFNMMGNNKYRKMEISLNPIPEWKIDIKVGAAKVKMDLSEYKVSKFNLETGATTTDVKFGSKLETIKANIEMGAATLRIRIPEEAGCLIKGDMVLVAKDLDGFKKIDKKRYQSNNFDESTNRIFINIDGGVSTLKIDRY